MYGATIGKHFYQLIMRHARPVANGAGIHVHERRARGRIKTDTTTLQA